MTENGDPYENALAERINGIIKIEFNLHSSQLGFEQTYNQIKKSIKVLPFHGQATLKPSLCIHSTCSTMTGIASVNIIYDLFTKFTF